MNVKRFTARTSREALAQVRQTFGADAVVLSTRPCDDGVEVLAMAHESMSQIERLADSAGHVRASEPAVARPEPAAATRAETAAPVEQDVTRLAMSTLSFQDYVRERLLRRRRAAMNPPAAPAAVAQAAQVAQPSREVPRIPNGIAEPIVMPHAEPAVRPNVESAMRPTARPPMLSHPPLQQPMPSLATYEREDELRLPDPLPSLADPAPGQRERTEVMNELRSVKGLIEERFSALAFMEQLHRNPRQSALSQRLLEAGFSPALIRKLVEHLPHDSSDEMAWAAAVLQRNLLTDEAGPALEDVGGVYALIGATGVGKTTSTAKIAAAFATRHGASNLGLITLDAYRMAAHEQLRAYGRILGVPVHTAHDRASLDDLLDLLSAKKLVLIDTAGMAQRDERTAELLEMLSHRAIQRLLVLNAATQGETIEDVMQGYGAARCRGAVLSKIDEAAKIAPTLDALVRHKLRIVGVANGQRVPEDWHRLSSAALVQRALRVAPNPTWRVEPSEINLVFAAAQQRTAAAGLHA
jgi:flagellar biosynthesis protein FlhF